MNFFWVNVGFSYDEVVKSNFLWAPMYAEKPVDSEDVAKGTKRRYLDHWTNVGTVRAGDIIFGNLDRKIVFVAVAMTDALPAPRPSTRAFDQWGRLGNKVPIEIFSLPTPIVVDGEVQDLFEARYNAQSKPKVFKANGHLFQGYMASIPDAAGVEILRLAGDSEIDAVEASDRLRGKTIGPKSPLQKPLGSTTKQAIRDARVGQGYFRQELLKLWPACPVTGVSNPSLLLASHVKPWAKSSDGERLDPFNGFLFAPHIDKLFDRGLIGFTDAGAIIINRLLSSSDRVALGIHTGIKISIHGSHKKYLAEHRKLYSL